MNFNRIMREILTFMTILSTLPLSTLPLSTLPLSTLIYSTLPLSTLIFSTLMASFYFDINVSDINYPTKKLCSGKMYPTTPRFIQSLLSLTSFISQANFITRLTFNRATPINSFVSQHLNRTFVICYQSDVVKKYF